MLNTFKVWLTTGNQSHTHSGEDYSPLPSPRTRGCSPISSTSLRRNRSLSRTREDVKDSRIATVALASTLRTRGISPSHEATFLTHRPPPVTHRQPKLCGWPTVNMCPSRRGLVPSSLLASASPVEATLFTWFLVGLQSAVVRWKRRTVATNALRDGAPTALVFASIQSRWSLSSRI
jgi:hypothetical protein